MPKLKTWTGGDWAAEMQQLRQQRDDQATIEDMERRAAPLRWALLVCVIVLALAQAGDFLGHYKQLDAGNEKLVQCLNERTVYIEGAWVNCKVREIALVGVQP